MKLVQRLGPAMISMPEDKAVGESFCIVNKYIPGLLQCENLNL